MATKVDQTSPDRDHRHELWTIEGSDYGFGTWTHSLRHFERAASTGRMQFTGGECFTTEESACARFEQVKTGR